MTGRLAWAASLALLLAGCGDEGVTAATCPAWTEASGGGCTPRAWALPSPADGVGDEGGRRLGLAVDGLGLGVAAWETASSGATRIASAEQAAPGGPWSVRSPGAALEASGSMPDVAASASGEAIVTFRQGPDGVTAIFASERDEAGAWSDPPDEGARLSSASFTAYEPRVAFASAGEAVLVFNQWLGETYGVAVARRPPGGAWEIAAGPGEVLSPPVFFSNAPQIALGPGGQGLIAWYQSTGGPLRAVASARAGADAECEHPAIEAALSPDGSPVDSHPIANPEPALGPDGEAAVVWTQENGVGQSSVYLAVRAPGGEWSRPAGLADAFSAPGATARCPQLAFGPAGDLYVVWYEDREPGHRALLAHRAPSGAWRSSGRAPLELSSPGADAITPALAVAPDGGVVVAWAERDAAGAFRIAARRGDAAGLGAIEVLSPDAGDASGPAVATGGDPPRALVGWSQGGFGSERVFFAGLE